MRFLVYLCKLKIAIFNDYMTQVKINDSVLRKAAEAGMDEFVQAFMDAIRKHDDEGRKVYGLRTLLFCRLKRPSEILIIYV